MIRSIPGVEDPFDSVGCGVAPDWFPALVLGRWGARELEDRIVEVTAAVYATVRDKLAVANPMHAEEEL